MTANIEFTVLDRDSYATATNRTAKAAICAVYGRRATWSIGKNLGINLWEASVESRITGRQIGRCTIKKVYA